MGTLYLFFVCRLVGFFVLFCFMFMQNVRNLPLGGVMKLSLPPKPSPIQT